MSLVSIFNGGSGGGAGSPRVWVFALSGSQTSYPSLTPFSLTYTVSDFFGNAVPAPGVNTKILLLDMNANVTNAVTTTVSPTPLSNSCTITCTFPMMQKGTYVVNVQADLSGSIWSAAPSEITLL